MSNQLAEVKLALAQKYDRLAKAASSKVKKRKFTHKAEAYRRQAILLSR
jgi:hypothetical protein